MKTPLVYIIMAIIFLVILILLLFIKPAKADQRKLTPLSGLAVAFVFAGIFFSENRLPGYILMGTGIVLAMVDIFRKQQRS